MTLESIWRGPRSLPVPTSDQAAAMRPLWLFHEAGQRRWLRRLGEYTAYAGVPIVGSIAVAKLVTGAAGMMTLPVLGLCALMVAFARDALASERLLAVARAYPELIERVEYNVLDVDATICCIKLVGLQLHRVGDPANSRQVYRELKGLMLTHGRGPVFSSEWGDSPGMGLAEGAAGA